MVAGTRGVLGSQKSLLACFLVWLLMAGASSICAANRTEPVHEVHIGDLSLHVPTRYTMKVSGWSRPENKGGLLQAGSKPQVIPSAHEILIELGDIIPKAEYRGFLAIEMTDNGLIGDFFCQVQNRIAELKSAPIDPASGFRVLTGWPSDRTTSITPVRTYVAPDDWKILAVPPVLVTDGSHFLDMYRRDFGSEYWLGASLTRTVRFEMRFHEIDFPKEGWRQDLKVIEKAVLSWIIYPGSGNPSLIHTDPNICSRP